MGISRAKSCKDVTSLFAALSQTTRLEAYRLLLRYPVTGLSAGDIARLLAVPHNTLSTHMAALQHAGLVRSWRSGRSILFKVEESAFNDAAAYLGESVQPTRKKIRRRAKPFNVLILCTANSARSVMAEAILRREGAPRFRSFSAGSKPAKQPNRLARELLERFGYDLGDMRSKSWAEFAGPDAPKMDMIITVCDRAANEACPSWPGHPLNVHWGIADPAACSGTEDERREAFRTAYRQLATRITSLATLPVEQMPLGELRASLSHIGHMEGATELALRGEAA